MDTDTGPTFAEFLRRARRDAELTQEQLAERAGISTRAVSDLERGINRAPQQETLRLLAQALELSPEDRRQWEAARGRIATRPGRASTTARSADSHLPVPLTTFIGREREVSEVVALLRGTGVRIVTVTGTGGVGKTRLAIAAAHALKGQFPDGAWFVSLAPIREHSLVCSTIATELGVPVSGSEPALSALISALRPSRRLIVLDNLEQISGIAPDLVKLLVACPGLTLLATSRRPVRVPGEHEYMLAPLTLPDDIDAIDLERLAQYEAVDLFVQRAQAITADFRLSEHNASAVAEICRRLDGLPLAIELAAARIRLLPPRTLLARLEPRLALLTGAPTDAPARQQTLEQTIAWSYELLAAREQHLFRALSVFHGGWTLDAVEALGRRLDADAADDALNVLEALIVHSLVRVREDPDGEPRYSMLETIREYAHERLDASDEAPRCRRRHARYFLEFAEQAEPQLMGADQITWMARLDSEQPNLRAAAVWAREQATLGDAEAVAIHCRLVSALFWYWHIRGQWREGREHIETAAALLRAHQRAIQASMSTADWANLYARTRFVQGAYGTWGVEDIDPRAVLMMKESVEIYRQLGQKRDVAFTLMFAGYGAQCIGEFDDARTLLTEAVSVYRELNDHRDEALSLQGLGMIALRTEEYVDAVALFRDSLRMFSHVHDERSIAASRAALGAALLRLGDRDEAMALLYDSLRERFEIGDKGGIAWCLEWLAEVALGDSHHAGDLVRAARLLGAAHELRATIGSPIEPIDLPNLQQTIARAQAGLTDPAFVAAWEAGRAMTLSDAVAYALEPSAVDQH